MPGIFQELYFRLLRLKFSRELIKEKVRLCLSFDHRIVSVEAFLPRQIWKPGFHPFPLKAFSGNTVRCEQMARAYCSGESGTRVKLFAFMSSQSSSVSLRGLLLLSCSRPPPPPQASLKLVPTPIFPMTGLSVSLL